MQVADALTFGLAFLASAALTGLVRRYAHRFGLVDVPNQRSLHETATPRGGGLGMVAVFVLSVLALHLSSEIETDIFVSLFVGGILVSGVGLADDRGNVSVRWRLIMHFGAATLAIAMLGGLPDFRLGEMTVDLGLAGDTLAVIFAVWLINLCNFMDGIDGIAATEAVCISASALLILIVAGSSDINPLLLVFAASSLGFLVWNWPPARIFMGDVGSGFIGFVLAVFAIASGPHDILPIWTWLILAGVFIVDATITLLVRIAAGMKWHTAHRRHAYQKAALRVRSHRLVTISVLAVNLLWLLPIGWYASVRPGFGWWLTLLAWTPITVAVVLLDAGRPESEESV